MEAKFTNAFRLAIMPIVQVHRELVLFMVLVSYEWHKDIPRKTESVYWGRVLCLADTTTSTNRISSLVGRSLCPADTGALTNQVSSLGSVLVSRWHGGIKQPNQLTVVVPPVFSRRTQGHRIYIPTIQVRLPPVFSCNYYLANNFSSRD